MCRLHAQDILCTFRSAWGHLVRPIANVRVLGLFGYINHDVDFNKEPSITIISGPNGAGKTHFLRILHGLMVLDLNTLASVEFDRIEVTFRDKWIMGIRQIRDGDRVSDFELYGKKPLVRKRQTLKFKFNEEEQSVEDAPEHWTRLPDGSWYDTRFDRAIPVAQAKRWGLAVTPPALERVKGTWAEDLFADSRTIFVDTQRLDAAPTGAKPQGRVVRHAKPGTTATKILLYINQVTAQLSDARRKSLDESLSADQTFAERVMQKARTTIKERELKERYERIADQHAELHASGMSVRPVDVRFPEGRPNPTEKRILNIFLDDWERKLKPLLPIHEKLNSLRRIIKTKFIGKELFLSPRGQIRFRSKVNGRTLSVHSLSSGEQHLLAVFTMLLFSAEKGALVLIDEPEISMHAAWKHDFLKDIEEVARISDLQIVVATHSSAIIHGNWHLVQEFELPDVGEEGLEVAGSDDELDEEV
ncbi:AAA family ATPase [Streptomyces sp. NPDC021562]|uniref:AAA family ATPase n=1 Tax=Streptomyces sp. NPDC021562 TaxID=3155121 RepID=UPI00340247E3